MSRTLCIGSETEPLTTPVVVPGRAVRAFCDTCHSLHVLRKDGTLRKHEAAKVWYEGMV